MNKTKVGIILFNRYNIPILSVIELNSLKSNDHPKWIKDMWCRGASIYLDEIDFDMAVDKLNILIRNKRKVIHGT